MGQARDYEGLIRELLAGVEDGWSYGRVIVFLMTNEIDETDLALWLRKFAEGLSLEEDRELIEQLKLLGKMTPGELASEALAIAERLDSSDGQGSEFLNHEAWFDRGNELYELGRYDESIFSFEQAIKINPEYSEAWFEKGITLDDLGRYEEAIASFNQAVKINSNFHLFWYSRGITLVHPWWCRKLIKSLLGIDDRRKGVKAWETDFTKKRPTKINK